jgi:hypothetical protein
LFLFWQLTAEKIKKKSLVVVALAAEFYKIPHLYFRFKNRDAGMNSDFSVAGVYIHLFNCIPHRIGSHDPHNYTIMKIASA